MRRCATPASPTAPARITNAAGTSDISRPISNKARRWKAAASRSASSPPASGSCNTAVRSRGNRPRRDHADGDPQGRRPRACQILRRDRRALPGGLRAGTVWTTGRIAPDPGAPSIIPAAEMLFQLRDDDPAVIVRLEDRLHAMAAEVNNEGRWRRAVERLRTGAPALMDPSFQQAIEHVSAAYAGGKSVHLPSGAGHDAQILATVMPAGMLFVPSIGGISHHWTENTADAERHRAEVFVQACRRLLDAIVKAARRTADAAVFCTYRKTRSYHGGGNVRCRCRSSSGRRTRRRTSPETETPLVSRHSAPAVARPRSREGRAPNTVKGVAPPTSPIAANATFAWGLLISSCA